MYDVNAPFAENGITIGKKIWNRCYTLFQWILDRVIKAAELLKEQGVNVTVADIMFFMEKILIIFKSDGEE